MLWSHSYDNANSSKVETKQNNKRSDNFTEK